VRLELRPALKLATCLLIVAMIGNIALTGWFDHRKHSLSGVPANHFALNESGRFFYVPRGGPPIAERPQVPLTAEEYRRWEENAQSGRLWAGRAALCFLAFVGMVVGMRFVGPPPHGEPPDAPPDFDKT
jgi:hypothetical protein